MSENIDIINKLLQTTQLLVEENTDDILKYLKDKSIPLEERWSFFTFLPPDFLTTNEWYGNNEININGEVIVGNRTYVDLRDEMLFMINSDIFPDWKIIAMKEAILYDGLTSVYFD